VKPVFHPFVRWPAWRRELRLLARERTVLAAWLAVLLLSALALWAGQTEVHRQRATIARLLEADRQDREAVLQTQKDWGGAAYASFHLSFDPPSNFAFAALGRRDELAWKHRVRMLALEGQIHERDAGLPQAALIGRFDFAFFAAHVLPLVLIVLLHDLRSRERVAGRLELLEATAGQAGSVWHWRAGLRAGGVFLAAALPLWLAGGLEGTAVATLAAASGALAAHTLFWTAVAAAVAAWRQPGEVLLAALLGLWMLLAVVLPGAGRLAIDRALPLPAGAEIVMTQREAVNDAWDLPKAATMDAFVDRHPQWAAYRAVERPFEWKWYFAFQQVGDQKAEALSAAYTAGRRRRDHLAAWLALATPPVLLERTLQGLARTDLKASLAYEARVRDFHAALRRFYYPRLFRNEPFERQALQTLPQFPGVPAPSAGPLVQTIAGQRDVVDAEAGRRPEAHEARD
jgi:ABC-2 type transport system permease protein